MTGKCKVTISGPSISHAPLYCGFGYDISLIMSPNSITYVSHHTNFYETLWLHYKTVLQHSLLYCVGAEGKVPVRCEQVCFWFL
jgi:hypothetical protein